MIRATDIRKRFGELEVLKGVSLEVARGEVVSIAGASGAGKTTLLQILGTLSRPDSGRLLIDGTEPFALGDKALSQFRNERIGFVFQFHHLLPEFTALENVMIPALIGRRDKRAAARRAAELLETMGLAERLEHKPAALSGSGWPSHGRWSTRLRCCWPTSPRATSIRATATKSTSSFSSCATSWGRLSSS